MPIVGQLTPLFVLFFLLSVAKVIKDKIQNNYEERLIEFIKNAKDRFQFLIDEKEKGKLELDDGISDRIKDLIKEIETIDKSINDMEEVYGDVNEILKVLQDKHPSISELTYQISQ